MLVKSPYQGQHGIAWYAVVPRLGATLFIYGIVGGGELMEKVKGLQLGNEFSFHESVRELCIPHPFGPVHFRHLVTTATVHRQVSG